MQDLNLISNIKNKAKVFQHTDGRIIVYIQCRDFMLFEGRKTEKNNYHHHHNLRFRSMIYGTLIVSYNPDMDFTLAMNSGWVEIIISAK